MSRSTNRTLGWSGTTTPHSGGVQGFDGGHADQQADQLGAHEPGHRGCGDAGEAVGERASDGHGRVGERGGGGEPVGRADVGADGGRRDGRPAGPDQREDEQHQAAGGDDLAEPERGAGPRMVGPRDRGEGEHQVGQDRPGHRPGDLSGQVRRDEPSGDAVSGPPAEPPVGHRHHRVEVRAGDRAEDEDEHGQGEHGGDRVFEQLQPDVPGRQAGGHDAGPDDRGDQQCRAEELGQQPAGQAHRRRPEAGTRAASSRSDRPVRASGTSR